MPNENTETGPGALLSTTQAAAALGVTRQTINRWIDDNRIAHAMVGKRYRIPQTEVDRMLAVQPVRTSA